MPLSVHAESHTAWQPEPDISDASRHELTVGSTREAAAGTGLKLTMSVCSKCPNQRQNDDSSDTVTVLAAGTCCKWHSKLMTEEMRHVLLECLCGEQTAQESESSLLI